MHYGGKLLFSFRWLSGENYYKNLSSKKSRNAWGFFDNEPSDKIKNLKKKKEIGIKTLTAAPYSFKNL